MHGYINNALLERLHWFFIPETNTTFIELNTTANLRNSFFPRHILGRNLLTFFQSYCIDTFPRIDVVSLSLDYTSSGKQTLSSSLLQG